MLCTFEFPNLLYCMPTWIWLYETRVAYDPEGLQTGASALPFSLSFPHLKSESHQGDRIFHPSALLPEQAFGSLLLQ